jgi:hypothetical protein
MGYNATWNYQVFLSDFSSNQLKAKALFLPPNCRLIPRICYPETVLKDTQKIDLRGRQAPSSSCPSALPGSRSMFGVSQHIRFASRPVAAPASVRGVANRKAQMPASNQHLCRFPHSPTHCNMPSAA